MTAVKKRRETHIRIVLSVAVTMANCDYCVKIKMNEKVMRLRSSTSTVGNLAMIFKLDIKQGILSEIEKKGIVFFILRVDHRSKR